MYKRGKIIVIFALLLSSVFAFGVGSDELLNSLRPSGAVNDFAGVIDATSEQSIARISVELQQKTGAAIVVVTIKSLKGGDIDDFSTRLFERWEIGQKGKDNGVLLLAAIDDRLLRIEVGYGLEGVIPDSLTGRIRRDLINPHFKKGNFGAGFEAGVAAMARKIAKEASVELTGLPSNTQYMVAEDDDESIFSKIFNLLLIIGFIIFAIRHPFLAMMLLSGGRSGGSSSGGGFGGGGFGGFGGGMSGGGGSSGGW